LSDIPYPGSQLYPGHFAKHEPVAERETAMPDRDLTFDTVTDVVVVGGGCAGLASALFTSWHGDDVVLLEKAPELGGTTIKSAFIYWVPNNTLLREQGIDDKEEDFLRYAARISRPEKYDPNSPTFGQSEWEFSIYKAIYESASPAVELLAERGVLKYRHAPHWTDYWASLDEDQTPNGRALVPADSNEDETDGGKVAIDSLAAAATESGVDIRVGHRVQRLIVTDDNTVAGVVATTVDGETIRIGARKAVLFGTGGFTHDKDLRDNFLAVPAFGGCAARTNEGDFVRIGSAAGAQLRNMQYAWRCAINLEKAVAEDPSMQGTFAISGDSMILVNSKGERTMNEKLPYNELIQRFYDWDPLNCDFPNRVMIQLWDQHSQDGSAKVIIGHNSLVPEGIDDSHVIKGETLEELADEVGRRLDRYREHTGDLQLSEDFLPTLQATIKRWNEMTAKGADEDFHRGERPVEVDVFGGPIAETDAANPVIHPISESGPYYACLLTGGTLDTKGGPKINTSGQVVDDLDKPIKGLYGAGNCVASASARAYWAGGGTLGPMIAIAYRAAQAMHDEPAKDLAAAQTTAAH
jgi:3-oxosteroid 1-dehydrogenase